MSALIQDIVRFNERAGLLEEPYDDFLESSMVIEEALEGLDDTIYLADKLGMAHESSCKEISRTIIDYATNDVGTSAIPDVDRADKACDQIFIAVGGLAKLGLNPDQITRSIQAVTQANLAKLSMPKDSLGKLTKPADFVGPEPILQQILDERNPS